MQCLITHFIIHFNILVNYSFEVDFIVIVIFYVLI